MSTSDSQMIQRHVDQLAEHWDCVQIMVSRLNADGQTEYNFMGSGNLFARRGMAQMFVENDQATVMRGALQPPAEDS